MSLLRNAVVLASLALIGPLANAQQNGTYTTGMGYTIEVTFDGDTLEVYEPANGKRSVYSRQSDGTYLFTNPTNGISYTMEVGDGESQIMQSARALRQIAVSSSNPCADAIPDSIWNSAQ